LQELVVYIVNALKWVATFEAPMFVERGLWCWLCDVAGAGTLSPYLLISRELLHPIDPAGWNNVPTKPCLIFSVPLSQAVCNCLWIRCLKENEYEKLQ
jgi:hypothetical protein